ncbi:Shedu immune nuclease family protein [Methylocaldum sp.]|uniref:Shedu immune nuclease family protein n=1 Tax=Methylocaldum sp. TaxID=1969727 RepID=UPI002D4FA7D1|nr:Shedu immune nuclease family protein [Methylocaldum sp.]HYE36286.1 Shedu immune nuclease family protein [Methylocaldum sp.]
MTDNYEYFKNKRTDRVYLSQSLSQKQYRKNSDGEIEEFERPFRMLSKVIDCAESHQFFKDGKQVSLRITDGQRHEITAKFYEDTREVSTLQIQKYTVESGAPHRTYFTFIGDEISVLYNFLRNINLLPIKDERSAKLDDRFVESIVLTKEQALLLLSQQPQLLEELTKHDITAKDVAILGHRRKQLTEFEQLLNDDAYFESCKSALGANKKSEDVWQDFFEKNTWIFGYGLNYYLNSPLDGEKFEQIVKGHDFTGAGKRVDALLKTHGFISALSFGEIKTHKTPLLKQVSTPYRKESWQISDELSGGIAQIQRSVQVSLSNIRSRTIIKDESGAPTGEQLFLYQPKSFLVIGSLSEFQSAHGINEDKYSSFELFRRNIAAPEIIAFDELYQRARFIVESNAS